MWQSSEIRFASDHPTAAGHFPSNPIIPGVLLLDEVVRVVSRPAREHTMIFHTAKFFRPVRPGETIRIRWQTQENGGIKFECRLVESDTLAAAGILGFTPVAG
jgi:3-hydroxymyristoyl/3-hydroxydecanoyl-(acyl carrier protein) dehydratase